jgi:hypothetical protein
MKTGRSFATIVAATLLAAQSAPPTPASRSPTGMLYEGRYMKAIRLLHEQAFKPDGSVADPESFQIWSQAYPFIADELPIDALAPRFSEDKPDLNWQRQIAEATPHDAIEEIVKRARKTSIVILNEAHYSPRDRAFALEVARALRPLGYDTLAAETFSIQVKEAKGPSPMDRLARDHVVRFGTGYYSRDPVYAAFVHEALDIGYRPIAYEQRPDQRTPDGDVDEREEAQAQNLVDQIFATSPHTKTLIYVGHGHVYEEPFKSDEYIGMMMAARLKQKTGIDPLTIDQTILDPLHIRTRAAYAEATKRMGNRPAIFFAADEPLLLATSAEGRAYTDLQVVHPPRAYRDGRPAWLAALGGKPLAIPKSLLPTSGKRLIQVFAADGPTDAVPLDQILVEAGKPVPVLMVKPQRVRFQTQE